MRIQESTGEGPESDMTGMALKEKAEAMAEYKMAWDRYWKARNEFIPQRVIVNIFTRSLSKDQFCYLRDYLLR